MLPGIFTTGAVLLLLLTFCTAKTGAVQEKFIFIAENVFSLSGGKLVISGQIKTGEVKTGEIVQLKKRDKELTFKIEGMEIFAKPGQRDIGYKNDYVAFTCSGILKSDIRSGDTLIKN